MVHKVVSERIAARMQVLSVDLALSLSTRLSSEELWNWLSLCLTAGSKGVSGQPKDPHLLPLSSSQLIEVRGQDTRFRRN